MSISSRWNSPLRLKPRRARSLSKAMTERLLSITRPSTMPSMSGMENAPYIISTFLCFSTHVPGKLQSYLVQLQVSCHGLVLIEAGVHQFLYLRQLMGPGNLVSQLRSLLTHGVKFLVKYILDMTGPFSLTPVWLLILAQIRFRFVQCIVDFLTLW